MISEGLGDIVMAIKGAYSRNISMTDYAIQKSISLAISLATGGFARAKEGGKVVLSRGKQLGQAVIGTFDDTIAYTSMKEIGERGVGETIKKVSTLVTGAFKEEIKTAGKFVFWQLIELGAKEGISYGVDGLINQGANSLRPMIA